MDRKRKNVIFSRPQYGHAELGFSIFFWCRRIRTSEIFSPGIEKKNQRKFLRISSRVYPGITLFFHVLAINKGGQCRKYNNIIVNPQSGENPIYVVGKKLFQANSLYISIYFIEFNKVLELCVWRAG